MPNYKDTNNKVHFLDSAEFEHLLPAGCVPITDEEAEAIRLPPAAQRKNAELSTLAAAYKTDLQSLQASWLAVLIADGLDEDEKREFVAQDIADLKAQYLADVAAVKLKYQP